MADEEHVASFQSSPPIGSWSQSQQGYPHSHHGTPAQEFTGFNFSSPHLSMASNEIGTRMPQRPIYHQLQPLVMPQVMPQWPSQISSQAQPSYQPPFPASIAQIQHVQPMLLPHLSMPVSGPPLRPMPTPRRTLTDADRRRMCQYAEDNPNSKQTEIGAAFGVERSTVSKVLRQKEKYLVQDDGSRSPIKRAKGRSPDIERTLAVWAKNQERRGLPLTDDMIREKAHAFAATTTTPENQQVVTASWIEKFKLKNNLLGARSRKGSLAPDDADLVSLAGSAFHTPGGVSPASTQGIGSPSPVELRSARSQDSLQEGYTDFVGGRGPFHSQSTTSLNSAFTDTASSAFSPRPHSPTSPFFTPDSGTAPGAFVVPPLTARPIVPTPSSGKAQRPRSQTFPRIDQNNDMQSDAATPKFTTSHMVDSPTEERPDPMTGIELTSREVKQDRSALVQPVEKMRPQPLPVNVLSAETRRDTAHSQAAAHPGTSPEEARKALEVVLSFFEQQPSGYLDLQESVTIGKLMERLELQQSKQGSN